MVGGARRVRNMRARAAARARTRAATAPADEDEPDGGGKKIELVITSPENEYIKYSMICLLVCFFNDK